MQIIRVGLDLAKHVFEVHAVDAGDSVVLRKTLRRDAVAQFFSELPACVVGMEACSGAHYWAKVLAFIAGGNTILKDQVGDQVVVYALPE